MGIGMEAWVTAALDEETVKKAMILAGSLRRVQTAKKLVVLTTSTVPTEFREKLKDFFDLVLPLEKSIKDGLSLEDSAKIQALSLVLFRKCVYLSPNALVLKNCDEIFQTYKRFAASSFPENSDGLDLSIFLYVPNLHYDQVIDKSISCSHGSITKNFLASWVINNIPKLEELDEEFNVRCHLKGHDHLSLTTKNASIINFIDSHPLDFYGEDFPKTVATDFEIGSMEKFVIDYCRMIYLEDVEKLTLPKALHTNIPEPIAIVGMSFRLPGGNNVDEFWSLLKEGRNAVVPVPHHRWRMEHSKSKIEAGFLNVPIDEFDAKFFGLSPKEAEFLDPQHRLLMELTWEALENAMIDPMNLKGTQTGVFVGSWLYDHRDMLSRSVDFNFFRTYMGNSIATSAARISHFLETTGPSIATESGCSSAIAAVDMACKSLRNGTSSFAIAGGVNLLLLPFERSMMELVLSPDFRCKTFDEKANGFARGEGCAVILLKRLSDAVRDGDNIWGLIRGTALTQEGISKSLGTPTEHCESLAMELALKDGDVDPKDVSYIECHGTGTSIGDPLEVAAITKAYSKGRTEPLLIGSVKTNVGHTESVSGITGIIKVLLAMKHELIPRHLNFEKLNPAINLQAIPAEIPLQPVPWPRRSNRRRIAGVSSFGISGTDGHAVIEEPPEIASTELKLNYERPLHLMKISAKSVESMDALIQKYLTTFKDRIQNTEDDEADFANVAYSANIGRATFNHRVMITARNFTEAARIVEQKSFHQANVQSSGSKLCFLFTGQGSQYPNMAKELYKTSPIFRDNFNKCEELLKHQYQLSIKNILWSQDERNKEELNNTLFSQTSIFVVEYCLLKLWDSWGVQPDYVIGHSLGEFAAAVAAGALNFEDAIKLVAERSRLIASLPEGKMLVIKADKDKVDEVISAFRENHKDFWDDYAALNSPDQTVVAGDSEMINAFSNFCKSQGLKTIILAATHAFHSRHMDPILESYRKVASTIQKRKFSKNFPKFISGMEGKLLEVDSIDADYWVRHTREKVSYIEACRVIQKEGCTLFLEIGPHPVLSALTMMNIEGSEITCLPSLRRNEDEWVTILGSLSKLYLSSWKGQIDWKGFDMFYGRKRIQLPFYPFHRKLVWAKFEPELKKIHPLLGRIIPSCSSETIFQNSITLKNTNFVQDHVIGNTIVFPGAGFLEMCLVGGHSTVQGFTEELMKPRRPIIIKSLKITLPLAIEESEPCKLQTLVTLSGDDGDEELGYSVAVHRHAKAENGTGKWIQHASAKFLPVASKLPCLSERIDVSGMISNWTSTNTKTFYEKLPQVGLRFGPRFQSLELGWTNETAFLASVKVPEDFTSYLIHPIIADAMIQAVIFWTSRTDKLKKLHVPARIGQFVWLKEAESSNQFVYCTNDEKNEPYCILVDESGSLLAYMKDVDFIETTVKLVEGMIQQQSSMMPQLWEEVWKNNRGPMQGYLTHITPPEDLDHSEDNIHVDGDDRRNYGEFTRLSVLKALYLLGWKPEIGNAFSLENLLENLNIKKNFRWNIQFFLRSMTKEDCKLLREVDGEFLFAMTPPTMQELEEKLKYFATAISSSNEDFKLIMEIDKSLSKIFIGEIDPTQILHPNDSTEKLPFCPGLSRHINTAVQSYIKDPRCRPIYRVLEIGAGTGVSVKRYLKEIISVTRDCADVEYYFSDATNATFASAQKELEEWNKSLVFKTYDIEVDPLEQGLCPGYFDAIIATKVCHSKDINKALKSVRCLLKSGGLIILKETIHQDERRTFVYGLLDDYWKSEEKEHRKHDSFLNPEMWKEVLMEAGFHGVKAIPMPNNIHGVITAHAAPLKNNFLINLHRRTHAWLLFGEQDAFTRGLQEKISNVNRKCVVIPKPKEFTEAFIKLYFQSVIASALEDVEVIEGVIYLWSLSPKSRDQTQVSLPFVTLMQLISELKDVPRTFAVMKGAFCIDDSSSVVIDPTPGALTGLCKSLMNEYLSMNVVCVDLDPSKDTLDQLDELFMNLWVDVKQNVAFRDGLRLCPRMRTGKILRNEPLSLPSGCDRFQLALPKTKLISDLEFVYLEPYAIAEDEVEIEIKAMALNFRDVFTVLKPIADFENFNTVGLDFSGRISKIGKNVTKFKIGDRVMGMNMGTDISLPSHLKASEKTLISIPTNMTFAEGATLPAVFSTAVYCLLSVAKMKKGETVLIHTASGGVGLIAIQLCKYIGAKVIATAGSPRKRAYLRNLGIEHVFHSRRTDFKDEILEATGGRGVDIVLNSITGPGFKEASLDVLGKSGRFIEMSKLNVWTKEEVHELRPDVFYKLIDLTTLESQEIEGLTDELKQFLNADYIKPIPYERFDALNIRGALNYLQKAKHIGKIVCIMPEIQLKNSKLIATTPLFNEDSTYLVTGGLGGIGYEVVKWMLNSGAKHVAIISRSSPKTEIASQIETWNRSGKHVKAFSIDVGSYEKCKEFFENLKDPNMGFPPLRGIMHAAGVLQDAVFENQSWDHFAQLYNPKVSGSWNLHDLTKDYPLEHFVLFSSIAAMLGSPGQSNHSASNAFEDSLATYRRSNGLPATSVNWGIWGEVGIATEMDVPGVHPISNAQGLLTLETLLKTQTSQMAVLNVESFSHFLKVFPRVKNYIEDAKLLGDVKTSSIINADEFWSEVESAPDREGKIKCFKKFIKAVIRTILKMEPDEPIDDQAELQALGIDSLLMLEMKNGMQNVLGSRMTLTASQLKDCNTAEALANTLVDIMEGHQNDNQLSPEDLKQLIIDDSNLLSESLSVEGVLNAKAINEVGTVLLTGATGNLGPYLLQELTQREQVKKIFCLVRSTSNLSSLERLKSKLAQLKMMNRVDLEKVEVVDGDITIPRFGLSEEAYLNLCDSIDAIVHSAVKSDHSAKYWKAPETNKNHVRTVNVLGTARLIQFAMERKLKHFFHASTMLAFTGAGIDGEFSESWQGVSAFDEFKLIGDMGYVISKHIAEQLIYMATLKGLPCKAFRYPVIAGDSKTGRMVHHQNHAILRWLACLKIGMIHDQPAPLSIIPADHCAKLSLEIFFNSVAPTDVYNIVQQSLETEQILVEVAREFGIEMKIVSIEKFMEKLKADGEASPIAAFVNLYEEKEQDFIATFQNPSIQALRKYFENGASFLNAEKMMKYAPDYEKLVESSAKALARDLRFLKDEGVFAKYGIQISNMK